MAVENFPLGQTNTYAVQFGHAHDEGLCVSPVAGPGPQNASIVRLYAPIEYMTIYWEVTSRGKPPLVPSHRGYARNSNRLFMGGERYGAMTPDYPLGHTFQMAGKLEFAIIAPEQLDSPFCLSMCPWEQTSIQDFMVPAANFLDTGILNPYSLPPRGVLPDPDVPALTLQMMVAR